MTQNRMERVLCFLLLVAVVLVVFLVINHQFQEAAKSATRSTLDSIQSELESRESWNSLPTSSEWYRLSDTEYDLLMAELLETASLDRGPVAAGKSRRVEDRWGARFRVAVRKGADGKTQWKVWSLGPDGELGTPDDISPY